MVTFCSRVSVWTPGFQMGLKNLRCSGGLRLASLDQGWVARRPGGFGSPGQPESRQDAGATFGRAGMQS